MEPMESNTFIFKRGLKIAAVVPAAGAVVLARANQDPAAAWRLDKMLDEALTQARDRALLQEWHASRAT